MCNLTRKLGFQGDYYIYDFPEFSLLQQHYLSVVNPNGRNHFFHMDDGRFPVPPQGVDLLVGCHSLSEADQDLRKAFFWAVNPSTCLITHQSQFHGEDLVEFFNLFMNHDSKYNWTTYTNPHYKSIHYIIGEKKGEKR